MCYIVTIHCTSLLNFNDSSNWLEFAFLFFQFAVAVVFNISLILLTIRCSTFKDFIEIDSERAKDDAQRKYKIIGMAYRRGSEWLFKAIGKGSRAESINQLADEVMSLR